MTYTKILYSWIFYLILVINSMTIIYIVNWTKVPLKLPDELNIDIVMKAVFLKPKACSVKSLQTVKQSAKGVS